MPFQGLGLNCYLYVLVPLLDIYFAFPLLAAREALMACRLPCTLRRRFDRGNVDAMSRKTQDGESTRTWKTM